MRKLLENHANKNKRSHRINSKNIMMDKKNIFNIELDFLNKVSTKDKAFLARQLATMLESGLPIDRAMEIFIEQTKNKKLKTCLQKVLVDVKAGLPLSQSMKKYPNIFDPVYINIIISGEAVGRLAETLLKLAENLEKQDSFSGKVKSALYYPAFMVVMIIFIVIIMMIYVIPPLKDIFADFGSELPWTTNMLLNMSDFMVKYWWIVLLIVAGISGGLYYYLQTDDGKHRFAKMEINFPTGIGKYIYMTRFCSTLSMLLHAGTPIIKALDITSHVMSNIIYLEVLQNAEKQMERGIPLSEVLKDNNYFDTMVPQMIKVGEETGKVDQTLDNLSRYYEEQSNQIVKRVNALIEPILIVIIGLGVALIVFAIIMPIYQLVQLQ